MKESDVDVMTVISSREEKYYVALAPDVDIASQGETIEEATANLKEALELYFEDGDAIRPPHSGRPIITLIEASLNMSPRENYKQM
ncbi:MAG: type II toxin-antitoxin system HicB family antitoxin [Candidatus Thorarchaeota archaeon]|nr:MAG: type II toxin-antitoxin system HicB family antitoxin [Candidatus Thorarchaeota archaeon]